MLVELCLSNKPIDAGDNWKISPLTFKLLLANLKKIINDNYFEEEETDKLTQIIAMALLGFSYLKQIINPEIETGEENFPNQPFSLSVLFSRGNWLLMKIGSENGEECESLFKLKCTDYPENEQIEQLLIKYGINKKNPLFCVFSTAVSVLASKINSSDDSDFINMAQKCLKCFDDLREVLKTEFDADLR